MKLFSLMGSKKERPTRSTLGAALILRGREELLPHARKRRVSFAQRRDDNLVFAVKDGKNTVVRKKAK